MKPSKFSPNQVRWATQLAQLPSIKTAMLRQRHLQVAHAKNCPGRVGDSPLVGSGGYADNWTAAASATGYGEASDESAYQQTGLRFRRGRPISKISV